MLPCLAILVTPAGGRPDAGGAPAPASGRRGRPRGPRPLPPGPCHRRPVAHAQGLPADRPHRRPPRRHVRLDDPRRVLRPLPRQAGRGRGDRRRTIDAVDVTGTAAMARATLSHGPTTLRDYFVLLKVDGEWRIANKTFSAVPPRRETPPAPSVVVELLEHGAAPLQPRRHVGEPRQRRAHASAGAPTGSVSSGSMASTRPAGGASSARRAPALPARSRSARSRRCRRRRAP